MTEGIFYRTAEGKEIPLKKVEGLTGKGAIFIRTNIMIRPADELRIARRIESELADGTKVILLGVWAGEILRLDE